MAKRNFYEILNSTPDASFDELKLNYKQLILQCHPDKLQTANVTVGTAAAKADCAEAGVDRGGDPIVVDAAMSTENFVAINEAWQTLKDAAKRKLYDAELLLTKFQAHSNIFERLTLADMQRHQADADEADDDDNENEHRVQAESQTKTKARTWYYTHACRCGGQYIIDDSADNEIFNHSSSNGGDDGNIVSVSDRDRDAISNCTAAGSGGVVGDATDDDADAAAEIIVECSECSLVIVLEPDRNRKINAHA